METERYFGRMSFHKIKEPPSSCAILFDYNGKNAGSAQNEYEQSCPDTFSVEQGPTELLM